MAAIFLVVGCSTVSVTTDADPAADFSRYRTYAAASAAATTGLSPAVEIAFDETLRAGMAARGIAEAKAGTRPDLAVVRHLFAKDKVSVQQYTDWGYAYGPRGAWPYRYGSYGMWSGAPRTYVDVREYTEGTLVLDFVDTRTGKLVYRGVGKGVVGTPQSNARKVAEAVGRIVSSMPAAPIPVR